MATFEVSAFDSDSFDVNAFDLDATVSTPVMPQEENFGGGGIGRLAKRHQFVAIIEVEFDWSADVEIEKAGIDDALIMAIVLAIAEEV